MTEIPPTELSSPPNSIATTAGEPLLLRADWQSATVVRITAVGVIDASNSDGFARYVFRYGGNSRRLILDLTDVKFFAVECFSTLNTIGDRCVSAGVAWTLIPGRAVARVLQICDPHRALLSRGLIAKQHRRT